METKSTTEKKKEVTAKMDLPKTLRKCFTKPYRYVIAKGGRGSGKSRSFALMTAVRAYELSQEGKTGQILCGREFQNSLSESSFAEVKAAIMEVPWLAAYFDIGANYIRTKDGRIYYTFIGLRRNLDSVKGQSRIHLCWLDEAENLSNMAYEKLIPTVREHGSSIWITYNPESKESATHKRFIENTPEDSIVVECNWRDNPWFPPVLEAERQEDLKKRPEAYDHIWEGDFLTFNHGAYYAIEFRDIKASSRITHVPYEPSTGVITSWDLGMNDMTSIFFFQVVGSEIRVIDFYENSGVSLEHYAQYLQRKPYTYIEHILPHDVRVKELGSGKSRYEMLQNLGLTNIQIAPQLLVDDGIAAVRSILPRCWFDAEKTEKGIDCLRQYHRDWDEGNKTWRGRPAHDWASHAADAFRYFAVGYRPVNESWGEPIRRGIKGVA
jgi:phage terminase large subunit